MVVTRTDFPCTDKVGTTRGVAQSQSGLLIRFPLLEADEAYVIGKRGQFTPVGAYLAGDEIIKIAVQHGVQMIHPGMLE